MKFPIVACPPEKIRINKNLLIKSALLEAGFGRDINEALDSFRRTRRLQNPAH